MIANSCKLVDRHFAGTITPSDERALRSHLSGCAECRERYDRWLVLARFDRSVPSAEDRIGRGLGLGRTRRVPTRTMALAFGLAAACAVVVIAVRAPETVPETVREMRARGGGPIANSEPALYVYRIGGGGGPGRPVLDGVVHHGDELAFAYRNSAGWQRLLVYAVDPAGRVYWYHPGWIDAAAAPVAIPIEPAAERSELPEAIAQPLPVGPVWLHAVFLDEALDVRAVERGQRPERFKELVIPLTVVQD
jgi:hypothetical protein